MEKNIVIIDDEQNILSTLDRFLTRTGLYNVTTFHNPLVALESIPLNTDMILLDVMMPQINGIDLLPKLKERYPSVKVVIMTAYSTFDTVLNAQRLGASDYIMKPFKSLNDVANKIKIVLE